jgi:hypothetical protein
MAPFLPLALAACGETPDVQAEPEQTRPEAPRDTRASPGADVSAAPEGSQRIVAGGDLIGEYRVAGIDGAELKTDFDIALSIDGPMLSYEPTCAGFVWTIAEYAGAFTFARAPGFGPTRQPDGSIMVCAVAVPPEMQRLGTAIDAARRAWRTPANGILLEGGGRSVLLFGQ